MNHCTHTDEDDVTTFRFYRYAHDGTPLYRCAKCGRVEEAG